jgi:hypothetical protein
MDPFPAVFSIFSKKSCWFVISYCPILICFRVVFSSIGAVVAAVVVVSLEVVSVVVASLEVVSVASVFAVTAS